MSYPRLATPLRSRPVLRPGHRAGPVFRNTTRATRAGVGSSVHAGPAPHRRRPAHTRLARVAIPPPARAHMPPPAAGRTPPPAAHTRPELVDTRPELVGRRPEAARMRPSAARPG
ncbi:hypothetical protein Pen02_74230 [Plantactinospora endophytica]|uniref:Uncharacterized protein n=1 Tax=Plantactinospora endophytica TaxID=673535 RepID=A0ABQ4ECP7_9ACTN|nr:hypothetical protein Pen02_74230 [Plantactinospora endophytica]